MAYAGGARGGSTEPPFLQLSARSIVSLAMRGVMGGGGGGVLLLVVRALSLLIPIFSGEKCY